MTASEMPESSVEDRTSADADDSVDISEKTMSPVDASLVATSCSSGSGEIGTTHTIVVAGISETQYE